MSQMSELDNTFRSAADPDRERQLWAAQQVVIHERLRELPRMLKIFAARCKRLRAHVDKYGPDDQPLVGVLEESRARAMHQALECGGTFDILQRLQNNPDELDDLIAYQNGWPT